MKRIVIMTGAFFSFLALLAPQHLRAAEERPYILFFFADDWGRFAHCYAEADGPGMLNDAVRTPHEDQIAREGVLFRRAGGLLSLRAAWRSVAQMHDTERRATLGGSSTLRK